MAKDARSWRSYEEAAAHLLNLFKEEFGVDRFEGKQLVPAEDTEWEIDAKGVRDSDGGFMIVECKHYSRNRVDQEKVGGLAFRIRDTGAFGGIIVTPVGLQAGAAKVAAGNDIFAARLDASSTAHSFCLEFLEKFKIVAGFTLFIDGSPQSDESPSP